jgi:hypothetical protein
MRRYVCLSIFFTSVFFCETVFGFAIRREAYTGESRQVQVGSVLNRRQNEISGNEKTN